MGMLFVRKIQWKPKGMARRFSLTVAHHEGRCSEAPLVSAVCPRSLLVSPRRERWSRTQHAAHPAPFVGVLQLVAMWVMDIFAQNIYEVVVPASLPF
jgi:hypothetical protein